MLKTISGKESHPGKQGRGKTLPTEQTLEQIYELATLGKSLRIIAARIGISYATLDRWLGNNAKFKPVDGVREAWEAGLAEHEEKLTGVLHKAIDNDKHKMQIPATMFMLKVKHKWRERSELTVIDRQTAPTKYKTKDITPDEPEVAPE